MRPREELSPGHPDPQIERRRLLRGEARRKEQWAREVIAAETTQKPKSSRKCKQHESCASLAFERGLARQLAKRQLGTQKLGTQKLGIHELGTRDLGTQKLVQPTKSAEAPVLQQWNTSGADIHGPVVATSGRHALYRDDFRREFLPNAHAHQSTRSAGGCPYVSKRLAGC